ncbi:histidinol-phosphate transaminase [Aminivibrio sp.]|uniref:pyridoxal phosphate-dependent aminotransferase n=1 Tax=Aminivibrio sp. TaxID=1872489 RepID=UPI001A572DA2|nr:histidinol-phosphate transaminase [Aminivibrio sp.]MBL3539801.1 histidinol-phosphate aminotransferase family protein [Aminivibrio sp.]MDK2958022.1 hypothetical protein [Synergistaceae bacterium]
MDCFVRQEVLAGRPARHGGLDYARLRQEGVSPEEVLDFSVSTNPFPPCPEIAEAVAGAALTRYPDSTSGELRSSLAELHGVPPESVLVTNGLAQAIFLCAFAFADRGKTVLITSPTFGEYRSASEFAGADVLDVPAREKDGFAFPLLGLEGRVRTVRHSLVWVCSPNNPTGILPSKEELLRLLSACDDQGTLLVLDEAYVNFAPPGSSALPLLRPGLLLLRSMTKDYGLTGLRLGYVLGDPRHVGLLASLQPPWSVNACAQAAGRAALRARGYYEAQWAGIRKLAAGLALDLAEAGFPPLPSAGNFLLFRAGDVEKLQAFLWERRILVRDCSSFGLSGFVRVGVKSGEENRRLVECLAQYRKEAS